MQLFLPTGLLPGLHRCACIATILHTLHAPHPVALVDSILGRKATTIINGKQAALFTQLPGADCAVRVICLCCGTQ
jgi:hypothetical protein